MIKLKKILGARCNAPEIVEIETEIGGECRPGQFYFLYGHKLLDHDGTEQKAVFVPIETVIGDGQLTKIKGYYVTEEMIFEGKLYGNFAGIGIGDCVEPHLNDANIIDGVAVTEGMFAFIVSIDEYSETGNVTFRLNL